LFLHPIDPVFARRPLRPLLDAPAFAFASQLAALNAVATISWHDAEPDRFACFFGFAPAQTLQFCRRVTREFYVRASAPPPPVRRLLLVSRPASLHVLLIIERLHGLLPPIHLVRCLLPFLL
jgi:hypothetical protein